MWILNKQKRPSLTLSFARKLLQYCFLRRLYLAVREPCPNTRADKCNDIKEIQLPFLAKGQNTHKLGLNT